MFSKVRSALLLVLIFTLAFAIPVFAGGWAVISLDELPFGVVAGEPYIIKFTVLQTGGTMLNATFTVTLPAGVQISWLRDQFLDFADALNLDALIEPWRPQNPM